MTRVLLLQLQRFQNVFFFLHSLAHQEISQEILRLQEDVEADGRSDLEFIN